MIPDNPRRTAAPGDLAMDRWGAEPGHLQDLTDDEVADYIADLSDAQLIDVLTDMVRDARGVRWVRDWLVSIHGDGTRGTFDLRRFLP